MLTRANLTDLIHRAQQGDTQAADALFDATYRDLRSLARARLRAGGRSTLLDTSSLVNEWYVRFASVRGLQIQDRMHFMRYAGRVMRSVIVDFARKRSAARRGGGARTIRITSEEPPDLAHGEAEVLSVHEALDELQKLDERMAQVVEMRYFGGMTEPEVAQALGVTDRTVRRDWEKARLWLSQCLR